MRKNLQYAHVTLLYLLAGCDRQVQNTEEIRIPLGQITGDLITFQMCGRRLSIPRKGILDARSDGREGVALSTIKSLALTVDYSAIAPSLPKRSAVSGLEIACAPSHAETGYYSRYQDLYAKKRIVSRVARVDIGLEQIEMAKFNTQQTYRRFEFVALPENGAKGFLMDCESDREADAPSNCEISVVVNKNINLFLSFGGDDSVKNWRSYRKIVEGYVVESKN